MNKLHTRKPKKHLNFVMTGVTILAIGAVITVKSQANSDWHDFPAETQVITSTMNTDQIEISLEDILKQYEALINSSTPKNKSETVTDLDKLYQLSVKVYNNAKVLTNSAGNQQLLNDLAQSSTSLTASIYEMKDCFINSGDFSQEQLNNSKEDLAIAIREIERVRQELKK